MYKCDACGKGKIIGKNSAHKASGRWSMRAPSTSKVWKPNLHQVRVKIGGQTQKLRLCTKCLRQTKVLNKPVVKEVAKETTAPVVPARLDVIIESQRATA